MSSSDRDRAVVALPCQHTAQVGHYEWTACGDKFVTNRRWEQRWHGSWL